MCINWLFKFSLSYKLKIGCVVYVSNCLKWRNVEWVKVVKSFSKHARSSQCKLKDNSSFLLLTNVFKAIIKAIIKYSQKVDLVIEEIVLLWLSKLDLLGILESACLGSIDGNSWRVVFWIRSKQQIFLRNIRNSNRMDKLVYCSYYFEFESR